jgi:hypothetical protein
MRLLPTRWTGKKPVQDRVSNTTKLLIGAGGLLLFIVGLKRSYRLDDAGGTVLAEEVLQRDGPDAAPAQADAQDAPQPTEGADTPRRVPVL